MRDSMTTLSYWDQWISYENAVVADNIQVIQEPSKNPTYRPQFVRDISSKFRTLLLRRYSRGDPVSELTQYFDPLLYYYETSEILGLEVWSPEQQRIRHTWAINLDFYIDSFWLVGLALALDIPNSQWERLIALVGNDGEDALLDRIIATRSPGRRVGSTLCYPKPYGRLLQAIDAPAAKQRALINEFVERWYGEVGSAARSGRSKQAVPYKEPYWHNYHSPMKGAYFGYWCLEAVAAVKAFGLDDSFCVGNPHYPGDLLRHGLVTQSDLSRLEPSLAATIGKEPESSPFAEPREITSWEALKLVVRNKLFR